ncbi:uncharacterized protein LOC112180103 [Rosa chinensis]|uniref:uncharacterized protein LOC112180103 n=1 Tax=Rosa chinensis TaxID=74649 RepID=UPI001AD90E61|nr:uncharacterized protein LOC112180103 [Rosa chinensis]
MSSILIFCEVELEMDLKTEAKSEMEPYMGLQRKVPECWKLETRRLASLLILKRRSFVHRGAIFKGRHIVGVNKSGNYQSFRGLSKLFSLVARDEIDDYSLAKLQNSKI